MNHHLPFTHISEFLTPLSSRQSRRKSRPRPTSLWPSLREPLRPPELASQTGTASSERPSENHLRKRSRTVPPPWELPNVLAPCGLPCNQWASPPSTPSFRIGLRWTTARVPGPPRAHPTSVGLWSRSDFGRNSKKSRTHWRQPRSERVRPGHKSGWQSPKRLAVRRTEARPRRRVVGFRHRRTAVGIAAIADRKVVIGSQDGVLYCFG